MKKVLAIMGSPRRSGRTYKVVKILEEQLKKFKDIDFEYVFLTDYNVLSCKGCELCLKKGEEYCPIKDDTQLLFNKISDSHGVIIASPNYALQVSGILKNFFDRLAYVFHRPCFFHKAWFSVVVEGAYGGKDIVKYLDNLGGFWGFTVCKGASFTLPVDRVLESKRNKINLKLQKKAKYFYEILSGNKPPNPSLKRLCMFRLVRTFHKNNPSKDFTKDYEYYNENQWFDSQYYYDVKLSLPKKFIGAIVDKFALIQTQKLNKD